VGNVLIIDDDQKIRDALTRVVDRLGHASESASTLEEGVKRALLGGVDVVFLDVRMPDGNGLDAIAAIKRGPSSPEVIVITGWGDPDGAERAMRQGAWDYIEKPPSVRTMSAPLVRAMEYRNRAGGQAAPFEFSGIAGRNPKRRECLELAAKAAVDGVNVLITGQTGAGKELFARAIHENSPRRDKAFVVVDCAALPQTIVESVLFGNVKGAFTGADRQREGLIVQAHGGTLFLDEVGELPLDAQKAFLRVLQERRVRPVGGREEIPCDFRLVAATNKDLDKSAREGRFRPDLLFRLQGIHIDLPPLKDHPEDILEFAGRLIKDFSREAGEPEKEMSEEFALALSAYPWPGNIRELKNAVQGALALARGDAVLYPVHLPLLVRVHAARSKVGGKGAGTETPEAQGMTGIPNEDVSPAQDKALPGLKDYRDARETEYLKELVSRHGSDIGALVQVSGLSRSRLYALLKKHGLGIPRY